MNEKFYGIIIDTNQYAGNFERELCAHLTGHYDEYEVGIELAELVPDNIKELFNNVITRPDESNCWRPVEIRQNGNGEYNSLIIYFDTLPTQEHIDTIYERINSYKDAVLETSGFYKEFPDLIKVPVINDVYIVEVFKSIYNRI